MSVVERARRVRAAVPPGEVGPGRAAAARELRRRSARGLGMILLPAVDIRDGKAVRLRQGDFDDETVYADDPLEAARSFVEAGARFLHVVDLDGAREGEPANLDHLERITAELDVPVQYGGGLRSIAVDPRARSPPGPSAWCSARPPSPTPSCSTRRWPRSRRASSWAWTCAAGWCRSPAGRARPRCAARTRSARMQQRGRHALRVHERRPRRDARGPRPRRGAAHVRGRARRASSTPAGSGRSTTCEALRDLRPAQPGRRDLRQGALRGPLRRCAEGQAALRGADAARAA